MYGGELTSGHTAIDPVLLAQRRERVFLVLAGIFICAMTMLNILGITRFIQLGPMQLAVGVLPYPITFLCTDLICELYGKARDNFMVTLGLGLNFFIQHLLEKDFGDGSTTIVLRLGHWIIASVSPGKGRMLGHILAKISKSPLNRF